MKKRNSYFDALRGIAILMVVAIHTYKYSESNLELAIRQLLNCAVPFFFAISAFYTYRKTFSNFKDIVAFWKHQISKVYIPTLIWGIPFLLYDLYSSRFSLNSLVKLFFCGYGVFYFIAVIIQFYLLLPFLHYLKCEKKSVVISCIISFLSVSIITYYNIVQGVKLPLILYAGCCLLWGMFFVLGCFLSSANRSFSVILSLIIMVLGYLLSFFESIYLLSNFNAGVGIKASSFLFSFGIISLLFSLRFENFYLSHMSHYTKWLEYIGRISFIIYLIHFYFSHFMVAKIPYFSDGWACRSIFVFMTTIILFWLIKKVVPQKLYYYLGIYD